MKKERLIYLRWFKKKKIIWKNVKKKGENIGLKCIRKKNPYIYTILDKDKYKDETNKNF